jgi:hypothetical protein
MKRFVLEPEAVWAFESDTPQKNKFTHADGLDGLWCGTLKRCQIIFGLAVFSFAPGQLHMVRDKFPAGAILR